MQNEPQAENINSEDIQEETAAQNAQETSGEPAPADGEMDRLKIALIEAQDQLLRQRADFENVRKAIYRDADKRVNIAVKNVVTKFLSVMDSFHQGIQSAEKATDISGVISGMKMIESMFSGSLAELDVVEIVADPGTPYDANVHQAISKQESKEYPDNTVLSVVAKGYTYQGFLVRPAMVVTCVNPTEGSET